jgi:hypothetical protein
MMMDILRIIRVGGVENENENVLKLIDIRKPN